ncbi:hypothetical protein BZG36_00791 [Bifiguratus adelaidae]|uniref:Uncharacterized protein n=1 Tax=Bifiguratus adelaidae TaxID=1938954 RepID=A0A261Y6J2_9FUNG|nr:hypothetical protein BZG36_00791 [Bifiguratus adelaidae]
MTTAQSLVEASIQDNKIAVFSKSYCPYCNKAKALLQQLGEKFYAVEVDTDDQGGAILKYLERKTGQAFLPNIFINKHHVGGVDDLLAAQSNGNLQKLLTLSAYCDLNANLRFYVQHCHAKISKHLKFLDSPTPFYAIPIGTESDTEVEMEHSFPRSATSDYDEENDYARGNEPDDRYEEVAPDVDTYKEMLKERYNDDDFDWDDKSEKSDVAPKPKVVSRFSGWHYISPFAKRVIIAIAGSVLLIGTALVVHTFVPALSDSDLQDTHQSNAGSNLQAWLWWAALVWSFAWLSTIFIDKIPGMVSFVFKKTKGRRTELVKSRIEYVMAVMTSIKVVFITMWMWAMWGFVGIFYPSIWTYQAAYVVPVNQAFCSIFFASVIFLIQRTVVQYIAISFHKVAYKDRLKETSIHCGYTTGRPHSTSTSYRNRHAPRRRHDRVWHNATCLPPIFPGESFSIIDEQPVSSEIERDYVLYDQLSQGRLSPGWQPSALESSSQQSQYTASIATKRAQGAGLLNQLQKKLTNIVTTDDPNEGIVGASSKIDLNSTKAGLKVAKKLLYSLSADKEVIGLDDFLPYFKEREDVENAFAIFDKDNYGDVTKREMKDAVLGIYKERKALSNSMRALSQAVGKSSLIPLGSFVLALTFIFGETAKNTFVSILFLFVDSDYVTIDDQLLLVPNMGIMTTIFVRYDGREIHAPNSVLAKKFIQNLRRSGNMGEIIEIQINIVSMVNTNNLTLSMWLQHKSNWQVGSRPWERRTKFMFALKDMLTELDIRYNLPAQKVDMETTKRLVRRPPLWERLKELPEDLYYRVADSLEEQYWDTLSKVISFLSVWTLNGALVTLRLLRSWHEANTTSTPFSQGLRPRSTTGTWLGVDVWLWLAVIEWSLIAFSFINAIHVVTSRRRYQMLNNPLNETIASNNARLVDFEQTVEPAWGTRFPGYLVYPIWQYVIRRRRGLIASRKVWELNVWDPPTAWLKVFSWFSPVQVLVFRSMNADNWEIMLPLGCAVGVQVWMLVHQFLAWGKDRQILYGQVFSEYNHKLVNPRLFQRKYEMATDMGVGTSDNEDDLGGEDIMNEWLEEDVANLGSQQAEDSKEVPESDIPSNHLYFGTDLSDEHIPVRARHSVEGYLEGYPPTKIQYHPNITFRDNIGEKDMSRYPNTSQRYPARPSRGSGPQSTPRPYGGGTNSQDLESLIDAAIIDFGGMHTSGQTSQQSQGSAGRYASVRYPRPQDRNDYSLNARSQPSRYGHSSQYSIDSHPRLGGSDPDEEDGPGPNGQSAYNAYLPLRNPHIPPGQNVAATTTNRSSYPPPNYANNYPSGNGITGYKGDHSSAVPSEVYPPMRSTSIAQNPTSPKSFSSGVTYQSGSEQRTPPAHMIGEYPFEPSQAADLNRRESDVTSPSSRYSSLNSSYRQSNYSQSSYGNSTPPPPPYHGHVHSHQHQYAINTVVKQYGEDEPNVSPLSSEGSESDDDLFSIVQRRSTQKQALQVQTTNATQFVEYHHSAEPRTPVSAYVEAPKDVKETWKIPTTHDLGLGENRDEFIRPQTPTHGAWVEPALPPIPDVAPEYYNPALLSNVSKALVKKVQQLDSYRELVCAMGYSDSFTGREAVITIQELLPKDVSPKMALLIARALLHCDPPLFFPIPGSEQSLMNNTVIDSPDEAYALVEDIADNNLPSGVFTPIAQCYSYLCRTTGSGCYAPRCPNRVLVYPVEEEAHDEKPTGRQLSISQEVEEADGSNKASWSARYIALAGREAFDETPKNEVARQEAINELIFGEDNYVMDLETLDQIFAKGFWAEDCIEASRKEAFLREVFYNYLDILEVNRALLKDLKARQKEATFVDRIGDVFNAHASNMIDPYKKYVPHFEQSDLLVKAEKARNVAFAESLKAKEKLPQAKRQPIRSFLIFPVTRMQRYSLLLEAILKKTPAGHPDEKELQDAITTVKTLSSRVDQLKRIAELQNKLGFKSADQQVNLELSDPARELIYEGDLKFREKGGELTDVKAFLFDHYFLFTKMRKIGSKATQQTEYRTIRRPIPLDMLFFKSSTNDDGLTRAGSGMLIPATTSASASPNAAGFVPFAITHFGKRGGKYVLLAASAAEANIWKTKIAEAQETQQRVSGALQVFERRVLSESTFGITTGKVVCSVPFTTTDGTRMIAVGTDIGVWAGLEGSGNFRKTDLNVTNVTQMEVIEENHLFLVLENKVLWAYPIDALISSQFANTRQKIKDSINYFNVGVCNNKTLIVPMKKRNTMSTFKAYEPVCGDVRDVLKHSNNAKTMFGNRATKEWVKVYKEFYVGADSTSVQFLRARIVVVCVKGFEIVNLENLSMNIGIPDLVKPEFAFVVRKGENIRPLAMFRIHDKFLLCYDEFAFFVDSRGGLLRDKNRIEWEGVPESVALYYPYVVAFDKEFVEVRHVETTLEELRQTLKPPLLAGHVNTFTADQVFDYMYRKGSRNFEDMTNVSKALRQELGQQFDIVYGSVELDKKSVDGTRKYLIGFKTLDARNVIETVMIPETTRSTLCISSQVGCSLNCSFCHTGTQKLERNLTASEIIGQYMIAAHHKGDFPLQERQRHRLSNIVFMGQGEPLYNWRQVSKAVKLLTAPKGVGLPKQRVTISTSGVVPLIPKIASELGVALAISLHATTNDLRDELVPLNKTYPLSMLLAACHDYIQSLPNRTRITFEYVMLDRVNDHPSQAKDLVRHVKGLPAHVNLIPFNPWPGSQYNTSTPDRIEQFARVIEEAGIPCTVRRPRGQDIMAACGQLKSSL